MFVYKKYFETYCELAGVFNTRVFENSKKIFDTTPNFAVECLPNGCLSF